MGACDDRVSAIAPSAPVALAAAELDGRAFPGDPADRFILATARTLQAPLVTRDEHMRRFAPAETLW
jgi:PIN domain nuclease of toxin-antitoxin system